MRIVFGLVFFLGCGSCDEPPVPDPELAQAADPAETIVVPDEVAPPPARPKPAPPTPEQLEAVREARQLLREGRRLAQRALWDQAATKFRESIERSDGASARCEFGWALFQTAQLEEAKRELERGAGLLARRRHREHERNTLGACLYNLGRVVEGTDPRAAALYFRQSLDARPNDTVAARLERLGVQEPAETACEPARCDGPFADRAAALAAVEMDENTEGDREETTGSFLTLQGELLAFIHYEPSWYVCDLGDLPNYGQIYGTAAAGQWVAGGEPEITFDLDGYDAGHEEGINNTMGSVTRYFFGRRGDHVVWYGSLIVNDYYDDGMLVNCECEEERWDNPGCCDIEDISSSTWIRVAYADSGRLRLTHGTTRAETEGPRTVEVVSLDELGCRSEDTTESP